MARNFAQLVFLAYCVWLVFRSNRFLRTMLLKRMSEAELDRKTQGVANRFAFLQVKDSLPSLLYTLNLAAVAAFGIDLVFQVLLGWFGIFAIPAKILNSAAVLLCGCEAYVVALMESMLRFNKLFILYHWDPDDEPAFASGILDILLCIVAPLAIVVSNFLAL